MEISFKSVRPRLLSFREVIWKYGFASVFVEDERVHYLVDLASFEH